jgi:hypothetical protein
MKRRKKQKRKIIKFLYDNKMYSLPFSFTKKKKYITDLFPLFSIKDYTDLCFIDHLSGKSINTINDINGLIIDIRKPNYIRIHVEEMGNIDPIKVDYVDIDDKLTFDQFLKKYNKPKDYDFYYKNNIILDYDLELRDLFKEFHYYIEYCVKNK